MLQIRNWANELAAVFEQLYTNRVVPLQVEGDSGDDSPAKPKKKKASTQASKISSKLSAAALAAATAAAPGGSKQKGAKGSKEQQQQRQQSMLSSGDADAGDGPPAKKKRGRTSAAAAAATAAAAGLCPPAKPLSRAEEAARHHCIQQARQLLQRTTLPFAVGAHTVVSLGSLSQKLGFHSADALYPAGYRASYALFVPLDDSGYPAEGVGSRPGGSWPRAYSKKSHVPLVSLPPPPRVLLHFSCSIAEAEGGGAAFRVSTPAALLAQSDSPAAAWTVAAESVALAGKRTQWRLRRCKALLNHLCCHPDIMAFLTAVDPEDAPDYAQVIARPVHMGIIDERLKCGR
jgi:Bromodomain/F/Y-rich N-terminus